MRSKGAIAIYFFLILTGLGGYYGCATNNTLVTADEVVIQAWANVENQYQRRADLVPNLIESVEAAADLEKDLIVAVRASLEAASSLANQSPSNPDDFRAFMVAQRQFAMDLSRLTAAASSDPGLRSVEAYRDLLVQLEGTENRIAVERRRYNEAVAQYNQLVRRFPRSIFAGIFGFEPKPGFTSDRTPS